jgi:uncharacterized protein YycO
VKATRGRVLALPPPPPGKKRGYVEARSTLVDGDLLCFRGAGLLSGSIRWLTKSAYSHVGIVYIFEDRRYCIEAIGSGVRLALVSELVKRYAGGIDHFQLPTATPAQRKGAISFAFQQLGKLYDTDGVVGFLRFLITGRKSRSHRRAVNRERWFCSEIVTEAYRRQGFRFAADASAYTSPSDIAASSLVQFVCRIKNE